MAFDDVLDLVAAEAGVADRPRRATTATCDIAPGADRGRVRGDRASGSRAPPKAASACSSPRAIPVGLDLLYRELERLLLDARGARVLTPADGVTWREPRLAHDWSIGYLGGVGMLTDGREPRHTHWPDAMQRMLADGTPRPRRGRPRVRGRRDRGGRGDRLSIADVNDPALIVAKAQGRTDVVVVMDDHVAAGRLLAVLPGGSRRAFPPGHRDLGDNGGLSRGGTLPLQSAHREERTLHRGSAVDRERGR